MKPISLWMLKRESRIYLKLEGIEGIPKCLGYTDEGLLLQAVDGKPLSEFRKGEISVEFLDELDKIVSAVHERGVVHSDLKKRANVLVLEREKGREAAPERPPDCSVGRGERERGLIQRPVILDFGAAFVTGEWLYDTFRRVDLAAVAKLRAHHQPQTLRPEQQKLLGNPTWAERLSRFLIRTVRDPFRALVGHER